jgi:hypothetical protein
MENRNVEARAANRCSGMKSVPPRGSGWVPLALAESMQKSSEVEFRIHHPPATARWY